jgi:hypothetical protein
VNSIATRLLKIIPRVTLEEFYWQDSHYSTDSRLGRELLYLIANDEWIRTTTEILDLSRSDAVGTTIRFDIDLDRITHEAFHAGTGQLWLPLFTLTADSGIQPNAALTVTDADGTELAPVPQTDVRHQLAAALAEIFVNFALTRQPNPSARRPAAGRDQRLLMSAALFRVLSGETGDEPAAGAAALGTDRLVQARDGLNDLLREYVSDLDTSPSENHAAIRGVRIVEAFTGAVVVVVAVDRRRSPAVLNVAAPARRLQRDSLLSGPSLWYRLLRARAHVRIDLLLPSSDTDRQVRVNLPDGVALEPRRRPAAAEDQLWTRDGLWIRSGPPEAAGQLANLIEQIRAETDYAVQGGLADLAITKTDILAETLRQHQVVPVNVRDSGADALLTVTRAELREATGKTREHLALLHNVLDMIAKGSGETARLGKLWDDGERIDCPLLRTASTESPGPRRLNGRAGHTESISQRVTPNYARINVPVYVPDANSGSVAKFAGLMSAVLMFIVFCFFFARANHSGGPSPSADALASALTLFSVIPFSRIEIPDRSTLRGSLSFAGTSLVVAALMPPVLLAVLVAFDSSGSAPAIAAAALLGLQILLLITLWRSPVAPTAGARSQPPRILSTYGGNGYEQAGVLRSEWWRSVTASALVTGREAYAYVVWEHPPSSVRAPADDSGVTTQQPSLHRLLGTASVRRAQVQFAALAARIKTERATEPGVAKPAAAERPAAIENVTGEAAVTEPESAQWPPNLLALLRSGTAREALTFLVFREPPENWLPEGGAVRINIDPDRLAPVDEATELLDIWVGVAREREFGQLKNHSLVTLLDQVREHRLLLRDTHFPAPPPTAEEQTVWARFRVAVTDAEIARLGPFLHELRERLNDDSSARRLLVRTAPQGPLHEIPIGFPDRHAEHGEELVPANHLDVVAMAPAARHRWRVLAICADAQTGIEHDILSAIAKAAPKLRLAALSHAVLHGTTVLLMLGHQSSASGDDSSLADVFSGTGIQVAVDEWQTSAQLGRTGPEPLLRVRARSQDRPGMLLGVLNALRPTLRAILPGEEDPYGAVWHAQLTVSAGRATTARIIIRLQVPEETVEHWGGAEYGEIERDARSGALAAAAEHPANGPEYGAPENTVITVNLIRALRAAGCPSARHPRLKPRCTRHASRDISWFRT